MASTLTGGSATAIHMHQAFFGAAPTATQLATYSVQAATDASGFASGMASGFVNTSSKALALQVLTNLNITPATVSTGDSYATLLATLERIFNDYGLSARGQIILNATNLLAGLESDATYGVAAQNYNTQATAFYAQSSPAVASGGGGGGGTPTPTISGKLVDGYVSGATIFADANGNGVLDAGEAHTTTDSKGNFSLVGGSGPLVGSGGTDLSTGLAFRGILKAPAGSTMINPLTSLQQSFVAKGLSVADAQTKVATAMGFSGSVDLTTFDPLAAALGGGADAATGAALQAAAVKLANFMVAAGKTLEGAGAGTSETAGNALLESMADAINADGDGVIDLTDTALLRSVMNGAATLNHPSDAALLAKVASIADNFATMSAAAAKNVDDALAGGGDLNAKMVNIAQSAVVAQGDMADQLAAAAAATDPDAAMNALDDNYTDAAFANVANSATVGDLDPNSTTDNAAAAASNAATPPTASAFTSAPTTVGATSNEAGTLKLFNNADGTLIGTATLVANVANTITVAAQPSVVTATLKVFDAAGNEATATHSVILGTAAGATIAGTAAAEFIYGFDNNDTITGDLGDDTMTGGLGNDTFNVDAGADTITDLAFGDILVVSAGATAVASLAASFDASAATSNAGAATLILANAIIRVDMHLATGSTGYVITAAGNTSASTIIGSAFADTITGGLGNDAMNGSLGNDTFNVEAGADTVTVLQSGDILVVSAGATANGINVAAFVATAATVNAGTATLTAPTSVSATISVALATGANGFGLVGSTGVDTLTGSAQADRIRGGGGADIINVGTGTDTIKMTGTGQSFTGAAIVSGTTALTGIDKVTGMSGMGSDVIDLSAISTTFTSVIAGGTIANATGNTVSLVRGNFNNATGIFTADNSVTGLDTLVVYDANGTVAGTSVEAILLVGSGGVNANIAAGVITLA